MTGGCLFKQRIGIGAKNDTQIPDHLVGYSNHSAFNLGELTSRHINTA